MPAGDGDRPSIPKLLTVVTVPCLRRLIPGEVVDVPVFVHPAVDSDELRASHPDWPGRVEDHALVCHDPSLPDLIDRAGATLVGYRELRELQRRQ